MSDDASMGAEGHDAPASMLLAGASQLLQRHGYWTQPVGIDAARTLLLAENEYFALGITEFADSRDLSAAEAAASQGLIERLSEGEVSAKRWDVYLVLLSSTARSGEDMSETITTIVYNTRYLRRIVRWDLTPESHVLTRALQPFLPLPPPPNSRLTAPMDLLTQRLEQFGIAAKAAELAVQQWREATADE